MFFVFKYLKSKEVYWILVDSKNGLNVFVWISRKVKKRWILVDSKNGLNVLFEYLEK